MTRLSTGQAFRNHVELRVDLIKWLSELELWQINAMVETVEAIKEGEIGLDDEDCIYEYYTRMCRLYDVEEDNKEY